MKSAMALVLVCLLSMASVCSADGPILLVTPQGVFQSDVVGNRPGPWKPVSIDVIVQGFTPGGGSPPITIPPGGGGIPSDALVLKIASMTKGILSTKDEAMAVASIIDALGKAGMTGEAFSEAVSLSAPLADASLKAGGRIVKWAEDLLKVSTDPAKLAAGVREAFGITPATTDMIIEQATRSEGAAVADEALDFAVIIELVMTVLSLLKKLGILS